jgi:chorismate mutase
MTQNLKDQPFSKDVKISEEDVARAREILKEQRQSIDRIDAAMLYMMAERFRCTETVSRLKAEHNLPSGDPVREREQIKRLRAIAEDANFSPDFAVTFLNFIIREVIHHHEAVAAGKTGIDLVKR